MSEVDSIVAFIVVYKGTHTMFCRRTGNPKRRPRKRDTLPVSFSLRPLTPSPIISSASRMSIKLVLSALVPGSSEVHSSTD